jgi:hypothetical protein
VYGEPGRAVERPVDLVEKARAEGHCIASPVKCCSK